MWSGILSLFLGVLFVVGVVVFEMNIFILTPIVLFLCYALSLLEHYIEVVRKPMISTRAKVIDIRIFKGYFIECLLPNKKTIVLRVSKKQVRPLNKNGTVELVYQGTLARSIRKYPSGVVIFHDNSSKKVLEKKANQILTYEQTTKRK